MTPPHPPRCKDLAAVYPRPDSATSHAMVQADPAHAMTACPGQPGIARNVIMARATELRPAQRLLPQLVLMSLAKPTNCKLTAAFSNNTVPNHSIRRSNRNLANNQTYSMLTDSLCVRLEPHEACYPEQLTATCDRHVALLRATCRPPLQGNFLEATSIHNR
jgi:hypothetical protein